MPKQASRKAKNVFYLVIAKGFFYCVPAKDLLTTGDATLGQEVPFKYKSLSLEGTIQFMSNKESDVLDQIEKEQKMTRKREKSFDAEKPRESALRQRQLMETMKQGTKVTASSSKESKKKEEKKAKKLKRDKAADITETSMITENLEIAENTNNDSGEIHSTDGELTKEGERSSGSSSIEPSNDKLKISQKKKDVNALKALESSSDDETLATSLTSKHSVEDNAITPKVETVVAHDEDSLEEKNGVLKADGGDNESEEVPVLKDKRKRSSSVSSLESDVSTKKRRSRSSSSSSTTSSSSSSSSVESSSEATSESSSSSEDRKKKKKKKRRKSKKSKKSKKHSKKSKKTTIKRNTKVYPGVNFIWTGSDPGVVRVHSEFPVYVLETDLNSALKEAKSPQTFIKAITGKVFTDHCLQGSTAQGFPVRNKGKKKMKQEKVLPQVDPIGRKAILRRAEDLESERKSWRPKIGRSAMSAAFTSTVGLYKSQ